MINYTQNKIKISLLKQYLVLISFIFISNFVFSTPGPAALCEDALPFCSEQEYLFPNETNTSAPSGPNYGTCPAISNGLDNPVWYYMEIDEPGTIQISLSQTSGPNGTGAQLDLDFVMWGPYESIENACSQIMSGHPPIQVSFDPSYTEDVGIGVQGGTDTWCPGSIYGPTTPPEAQVGEVYVIMITNPSGSNGYVSFAQVGGTGSSDCALLEPCNIENFTADVSDCTNDTYSVSGQISFTDPPDSGDLIVEDCNGNQVIVASAPFNQTSYSYNLSGLSPDGEGCSVKVYFTDVVCHETIEYTAPQCLCDSPTLNVQELTSCTGSVFLNDAIISNQGQGTLTFHSSSNDANNGVNIIGNSVSTTGSYWVRAENPQDPDCFSVYEIIVKISDITYTITDVNPSCGDNNGSIQITASGGTTPYGYGLNVGGIPVQSSTGLFEDLAPGVYDFVIVDDIGCQVIGTHTLVDDNQTADPYFEFDDFCEGAINGPSNVATQGGTYSFNPDPTDGAIINPLSGAIINGVAGATYTIVYTVGTSCPAVHTVTVNVNSSPSPTFVATNTSGCKPLPVSFVNTSSVNNATCLWDFGDGSTSNACDNVTHEYSSSGLYNVSLTITDNNGCSSTITEYQLVDVINGPKADFSADPMVVTTDESEVSFTNNSEGSTEYIWNFGDDTPNSSATNPIHSFPKDKHGTYVVTLIASNGSEECNDTMRVVITVEEDLIFYVPNSFTPDNDNFNEVFKPIFTSGFDPQSYSLEIYNRWGETVFESHNTEVGWDGTYGADSNRTVPEGTYIWKIKVKEIGKDKYNEYNGYVTILR